MLLAWPRVSTLRWTYRLLGRRSQQFRSQCTLVRLSLRKTPPPLPNLPTRPSRTDKGRPKITLPFSQRLPAAARIPPNPSPPLSLHQHLRAIATTFDHAPPRARIESTTYPASEQDTLSPRILIWLLQPSYPHPPRTGLFHDPYIDPNEQHRPSEQSRHTLNPTGPRASEELGDFNTSLCEAANCFFPECRPSLPTVAVNKPPHHRRPESSLPKV